MDDDRTRSGDDADGIDRTDDFNEAGENPADGNLFDYSDATDGLDTRTANRVMASTESNDPADLPAEAFDNATTGNGPQDVGFGDVQVDPATGADRNPPFVVPTVPQANPPTREKTTN